MQVAEEPSLARLEKKVRGRLIKDCGEGETHTNIQKAAANFRQSLARGNALICMLACSLLLLMVRLVVDEADAPSGCQSCSMRGGGQLVCL